jgi:hypothetical protein
LQVKKEREKFTKIKYITIEMQQGATYLQVKHERIVTCFLHVNIYYKEMRKK